MELPSVKSTSSNIKCVEYVKLEEFVVVDADDLDPQSNKIPDNRFLHSFSACAKTIHCRTGKFLHDTFSGFPKKELVDSVKVVAKEAEPFLVIVGVTALFPIGVVVAAGVGVLGVPLMTANGAIYGGLYLGDRIYANCKPESNHELKWSDKYANLF